MKRKKIEEIKSPMAVQEIISVHEKFEKTISVNGCNGSSDLGQLASAAANLIRDKVPNAFVRCPYALFPEIEGPAQVLLYEDYQIAIDGCQARCLAKTLEKAEVKVDLAYALDEDFGLEKKTQPAQYKKEDLEKVVNKIIEDVERLKMKREPKK